MQALARPLGLLQDQDQGQDHPMVAPWDWDATTTTPAFCDSCSSKSARLGNNRLSTLPKRFGQLTNLDWGLRHTSSSVLDGNPLRRPPLDVCKQGVEAIAKYLGQDNGSDK